MPLPSNPSLSDSLKSSYRTAFYESHKSIALAMILIVFLAPLFGVAIKGFHGAVIGLLLSIAAYYIAPYLVMKLRT
jgi:hypothetical protein